VGVAGQVQVSGLSTHRLLAPVLGPKESKCGGVSAEGARSAPRVCLPGDVYLRAVVDKAELGQKVCVERQRKREAGY
jgi:hypothetical protein